jgi:hypothetical protein
MSSTEAELMSMNQGAATLKWLKMLLNEDLNIRATDVRLYGDNLSTLAIIRDPLATERTRHIDQKNKKIQEYVNNHTLSVHWVPTTEQLADCLTKQLPKGPFERARSELGVQRVL